MIEKYLNEGKELSKKDKDRIIKIIKYSREITEYGQMLRGFNIKDDPDAVNKIINNINKFHKLLKGL